MLFRQSRLGALIFCILGLSFLANCSFAQGNTDMQTRPIAVFENQQFAIEFTPTEECVEKYGKTASSKFEDDIVTISYEILEYNTLCSLTSPALPGPWALGHFLVPVEGLPEGRYAVEIRGLFDGEAVAGSSYKTVNVLSTDHYVGEGLLHFGLGSPKPNEVVSGIGVIRGWACTDEPVLIGHISYKIDDNPIQAIPYGSSRRDTKTVCGGKVQNGYGAVINWNRFSLGEHTFKLFVDGQEVVNQNIVVSGTGERFLKGLDAEYVLDNFPNAGDKTTVRWSQSAQDFTIVDVERE